MIEIEQNHQDIPLLPRLPKNRIIGNKHLINIGKMILKVGLINELKFFFL